MFFNLIWKFKKYFESKAILNLKKNLKFQIR